MGADAKRKEARKRKFDAETSEHVPDAAINFVETSSTEEPPEKKRSGASPEIHQDSETSIVEDCAAGNTEDAVKRAPKSSEMALPKSQRFIVFIGNLPYTATDAAIKNHFAKVQPKSIRHRTEKEGGQSKGFAFLEFEGYDRMKTCLKLFHGSSFDDAISPARKINVELTVGGGGGKSKDRKGKLRVKNDRLNEQRLRRAQEEEKQSKKAESKKLGNQGQNGVEDQLQQEMKVKKRPKPDIPVNNGDIHPSRISRVAAANHDRNN